MHSRHTGRGGGIDSPDDGVGQRTSDERSVEKPRQLQVVEKAAAALDQRKVFNAFDGLADVDGIIQGA
jgi:hypothetical protein